MEEEQINRVLSVNKPLNIETFISLSCTKCPEVVQALNLISLSNPNITASLVDGGVYPEEVAEKNLWVNKHYVFIIIMSIMFFVFF